MRKGKLLVLLLVSLSLIPFKYISAETTLEKNEGNVTINVNVAPEIKVTIKDNDIHLNSRSSNSINIEVDSTTNYDVGVKSLGNLKNKNNSEIPINNLKVNNIPLVLNEEILVIENANKGLNTHNLKLDLTIPSGSESGSYSAGLKVSVKPIIE